MITGRKPADRDKQKSPKPRPLKKGDRVGIIVCASPVKEPFVSRGKAALARLGYVPVTVPDIKSSRGYIAREPHRVITELQDFFNDPGIACIWAARGGYGANLLLPLMGSLHIPEAKLFVGSSDVSVLLWALMEHSGMPVVYGPMACAYLAEGRYDETQMQQVLGGNTRGMTLSGEVMIPGECSGTLTGGCLSNLVSLAGTPYFPKTDGRILLLEDVNERPFRLDRMLWQLQQSGKLDPVAGIVLGDFPGCFTYSGERSAFKKRVREILGPVGVPVLFGLPFGHGRRILTVPLGVSAELACHEEGKLKILESATQ